MQITIFSTTTCPYCKLLKDYLSEKSISFNEKLIDMDELAKKEMEKESAGFLGVPFTVVHKDDGSKATIIGFDRGRVNEILGIQG